MTPVFEPCEEGGFHSFIKEMPGVHSEGETLEEAQQNLMDAFGIFLSYRLERLSKRLNQALQQKSVSRQRYLRPKLVAA